MAKRHGIRKAVVLGGAVLVGAAVVYLWDPDHGAERRGQLRDRYQNRLPPGADETEPFDIVDVAGRVSFQASDPPAY
jgi:hypothetical protein